MITQASERVFSFRDHASLWFSLGVGLLVIQVGAYLVPSLGTQSAFIAIAIGSILGAGLLAVVAQLGSDHGLPSSGLMQQTLGSRFAKLPVVLNVIQLMGWAAFELVIMRDATAAMVLQATGLGTEWIPALATLFFGALLYVLASSSMVRLVRQFVSNYALPMVVLSLMWLTVQFMMKSQASPGGLLGFWNEPGTGGMSTIAAIDLVMAMPVSWLPLVADYSRYSKTDTGRLVAFRGTWLGYGVANIWCYALGVLVASTSVPGAALVTTLLLAQFGLIALGLILIDEIDNAYGDVHSGAVSLNYLNSQHSVVFWGRFMTAVVVMAAIFLPMHSLEPFLLILSSVFVPLFGVIIGWLSFGGKPTEARIHWPLAGIWVLGIAVSYYGRTFYPALGQAIPGLSMTVSLMILYRGSLHILHNRLRKF